MNPEPTTLDGSFKVRANVEYSVSNRGASTHLYSHRRVIHIALLKRHYRSLLHDEKRSTLRLE
jgi:hypothetical protein